MYEGTYPTPSSLLQHMFEYVNTANLCWIQYQIELMPSARPLPFISQTEIKPRRDDTIRTSWPETQDTEKVGIPHASNTETSKLCQV